MRNFCVLFTFFAWSGCAHLNHYCIDPKTSTYKWKAEAPRNNEIYAYKEGENIYIATITLEKGFDRLTEAISEVSFTRLFDGENIVPLLAYRPYQEETTWIVLRHGNEKNLYFDGRLPQKIFIESDTLRFEF